MAPGVSLSVPALETASMVTSSYAMITGIVSIVAGTGLSCSNVAFPEGVEGSLEAKAAVQHGEAALCLLCAWPSESSRSTISRQLDQRQSPPHKSVMSCSF